MTTRNGSEVDVLVKKFPVSPILWQLELHFEWFLLLVGLQLKLVDWIPYKIIYVGLIGWTI